MSRQKPKPQYEDCYNLYSHKNGEYIGTIKVPNKADLTTRLLRVHKVLPFTKKMCYLLDYSMEFVGTYPRIKD